MPTAKKVSSALNCLLNLYEGDYYERLNTGNIRGAVIAKTPFIAGKNTIYGRWEEEVRPESRKKHLSSMTRDDTYRARYVVYSYGEHFPMFIWDEDTQVWFGNSDKYSVTTSRHQHAANPTFFNHNQPNRAIKWVDTNTMIAIARYGVFATACHAAGGNAFDTTED